MCLSTYEVNPLCDDCFAKLDNLADNQILTNEDLCGECRALPKYYCFCCDTDQRCCKEDMDIVDGICRSCGQLR